MDVLRKHWAGRSLVLLMAGIILNLSIDPPDREAMGMLEDTSVNEIESFVELVAEQWLGIEDFLPEHDESDDTGSVKKGLEFAGTRYTISLDKVDKERHLLISYPFADHFTAQYEPEPRVPPPWA